MNVSIFEWIKRVFESQRETNARLKRIEETNLVLGEVIMADLTDLTAKVTAATTVEASAVTLIQGLSAQLKAAGTDPTALAALSTQLDTETQALAAAVAANTPATTPTVVGVGTVNNGPTNPPANAPTPAVLLNPPPMQQVVTTTTPDTVVADAVAASPLTPKKSTPPASTT